MISLTDYTPVYYNILLLVVCFTALDIFVNPRSIFLRKGSANVLAAIFLLIPVVIYIGLRPISDYFGDMENYENYFYTVQKNWEILSGNDNLFVYYIKFCSSFLLVEQWFFLTSAIFIIGIYLSCKREFPHHIFVAFLMCISALIFYGSAVNGIRSGMASSFLLFGIIYFWRSWWILLFIFIAAGLHNSMYIPAFAVLVTHFYKNTKIYVLLWLSATILSLSFSGLSDLLINFFSFADVRVESYSSTNITQDKFSDGGFRFDFVLYSIVPILLGYYTVIHRKIKDEKYIFLLNFYIFTNLFWILVIHANYSNRFASLSWFIYPIVLIYPFLKFDIWKNKRYFISLTILLHFLVSYLIN